MRLNFFTTQVSSFRALQSFPAFLGSQSPSVCSILFSVFTDILIMRSMEIQCTACGATTLVRADPVYDGFKKTGEAFICMACGTRYASAEVTPFVHAASCPRVFTEADKPQALSIFSDDERQKSCGWCTHFVVNPFSQRCGLTNKETQATDLCVRFEKKVNREQQND